MVRISPKLIRCDYECESSADRATLRAVLSRLSLAYYGGPLHACDVDPPAPGASMRSGLRLQQLYPSKDSFERASKVTKATNHSLFNRYSTVTAASQQTFRTTRHFTAHCFFALIVTLSCDHLQFSPIRDALQMSSWDYIAKLVCIGDSGTGKSSLVIRLCEGRFSPHHDVTIGVEFGSRIVPVGPPNHSPPKPNPSISRDPSANAIQPDDGSAPHSETDTPKKSTGGLPEPPTAKPKEEPVEQKHMKLSLWDTAGQETYKSVTRSYFRGASGALLVFDISRRQTFAHAQDWLSDLRAIAEPDIVVILVGNKSDLAEGDGDKREVTVHEAEEWAKKNQVLEYVETSAKSGEGVEKAFARVAERIYENIEAGKYDLHDRRSGVKGPGNRPQGGVKLSGTTAKGSAGGCC